MPIVSRALESVQPGAAGSVMASFLAIDDAGREWRRSHSRFANLAAAEAASDTFDWELQLLDREEQESVDFINSGGAPDAFARVNLTQTQFRRRLVLRFWRSRFELDRRFVCNVANWITGFSAGQIASALGITVVQASGILDRASHLSDTLCPAAEIDDGGVGGESV